MKTFSPPKAPASVHPLIVFLLLLSAVTLAYAPALNGSFLWDDHYLVGDNPFFKSPIFILEIFRHYLFVDSVSTYYRPVQNITYMFDYWLWGSNPLGYHAANVFYHSLAGFLIFRLLQRLTPSLASKDEPSLVTQWLPVGVATIWCVHPIHNAGVAYVAGRADSLAAIFSICAWLIALRTLTTRNSIARAFLAIVAVCSMVLAIASKEIALVWLALFVAWLWIFKGAAWKHALALTAGALISLFICWMLRNLPEARAAVAPDEVTPWGLRILLMFRALGDYTSLIFYPDVLRMERIVFNPSAGGSLELWKANIRLEYLGLLGAATLIALATLCLLRKPGQRIRIFGMVWFFIGFLPISNLFPLNAQVAEHWIYMPSAGFLLFLAGCFPLLPHKALRFAGTAVVLFAIGLAARTSIRSADWSDSETFYLATINNGGGSPRLLLNLAVHYLDQGDLKNAEALSRKILDRFPDYAGARVNLGSVLLRAGKSEEARKLLTIDPAKHARMANRYGSGWAAFGGRSKDAWDRGNSEEALQIVEEGIAAYPNEFVLVQSKAHMLYKLQNTVTAIAVIQAYCDRYWWRYEPFISLGRLCFGEGEYDAAVFALRHAAKLDIRSAEPHNLIARIEFARGRFDAALLSQRRAVNAAEFEPSQYLLLAQIHEKLGQVEESKEAIATADELCAAVTH